MADRDEADDVAVGFGAKQCVECGRLCVGSGWVLRHAPMDFPGALESGDGVRSLVCVCRDDDDERGCAGRLQFRLVEHGR